MSCLEDLPLITSYHVHVHRLLDKRSRLDDWGEDRPRLLVGVNALVNELSGRHKMRAQQQKTRRQRTVSCIL